MKHEYIETLLSGRFMECPKFIGITVGSIQVRNHHKFSCGWIKEKDMRVFDAVKIFKHRTHARASNAVWVGLSSTCSA